MKYRLLILLGLLLFCAEIKAQDPVYSQFFAAPMQLNPALTGLVEAPVVTLNYRNQWPNIPDAYATYAVSVSHYASKLNSGFGALVEADIAGGGIYATYRVGLFYAYDIRFSKKFYIRAGLEGSFVNSRLAWNKLVFLDQLNLATGSVDVNGNTNPTNEAQGSSSINYFDLGTGILVNTPYFYAGVSVKHLTTPRESFLSTYQNGSDELPIRYAIHAGSEIRLTKNNKIGRQAFLSPNVLFVKQRDFHQLNVGTYARYGIFLGGIWFRHTFTNADAVIFMVGIQKGVFKLGYSYDLTVSKLGAESGGAHEISLTLNFENKKRKHQNRYNDCLEIFR
jgi:type IX secretion system PorP/SprF family membrane protein